MKRIFILNTSLLLAAFFVTINISNAADKHVPTDHPTIIDAINAAVDDDNIVFDSNVTDTSLTGITITKKLKYQSVTQGVFETIALGGASNQFNFGAGSAGSSISDLIIQNATVSAVNSTQSLSITHAIFNNNSVTGSNTSGGAILNSGVITITGVNSFTNNTSQSTTGYAYAGALYNDNASSNITFNAGSVISGNQSISANGVAEGGAIYSKAGSLTLTGATIDGNVASAAGNALGGAIYNDVNSTLTINGAQTITNNIAQSTNGAALGGAIYNADTSASDKLNFDTGSNISHNKAISNGNSRGGAIYNDSVGALSLNSVTIDGNQVSGSIGYGGAIFNGVNSALKMSGRSTIVNNTVQATGAARGGALYNIGFTNSSLNFSTGSIISNNKSISTGGDAISGAIYLGAGSLSLTGTTVDGNQVSGGVTARGGAIYDASVTTTTINGGTSFTNNTSSGSGGAIFNAGTLIIDANAGDIIFSSNVAGSATLLPALGRKDNSLTATNYLPGSGGAIWSLTSFNISATTDDVNFTNNSAGGIGGAIYLDDGTLTMSSVTANITFLGNTQGNFGTPVANAIYFENATGNSGAIFNTGINTVIEFYDPIQNNAANGLFSVVKNGNGMVSFDGINYANSLDRWSQVYANTQVNGGVFEVANNAVYGMHATDAGQTTDSVFSLNAGTLQGGLKGTLIADQVVLGNATTLNIAGRQQNVRGVFEIDSNSLNLGTGSRVLFNTYLNDAVIQNTDLLVLNHAIVNGTAFINVKNAGGTGALTVGNGIRLVQVTNQTAQVTIQDATQPNTFKLAAPVVAGPYQYALYRGGLDGADPDDWFLRSFLQHPGEEEEPFYRGEVSLYSAIPSMGLLYGRMMLDTLQERVGDEELLRCQATRDCPFVNGVWVRLINDGGKRHDGGVYEDGPNFDYHFRAVQTGLDIYRQENHDGSRDHAGVFIAHGDGGGNVKRLNIAASAEIGSTETGPIAGRNVFNTNTGGAYWTHFGCNGWYLDGVLIANRYDVHTHSQRLIHLKTDGNGYGASLEGGYPFKYQSWSLEPEGQIVYQTLKLANGFDEAANVTFRRTQSFIGSIGARLANTWNFDPSCRVCKGRKATLWLRARGIREFSANSHTIFSSEYGPVGFHSKMPGNSVVTDVGGTGQITNNVYAYASMGRSVFLHGHGHNYDAIVGLRVNL